MSEDFLQDRAALYVVGLMSQPEREEFELILEFHGELWELVCGYTPRSTINAPAKR